jgi:hypothetical protein
MDGREREKEEHDGPKASQCRTVLRIIGLCVVLLAICAVVEACSGWRAASRQ